MTPIPLQATNPHRPQMPFDRKAVQTKHSNLEIGRRLLQYVAPRVEQTSHELHQIVLWLQGISRLLRVHLQRLFHHSQVTHHSYTLARFRQTQVVYCRVSTSQHLQRFVYIGSTSSMMTKRESTRNRKYKQIQEHKIVQAELSLRWWHKHKCYQQFTPIVLQTNIPLHELEATENTMIQHHQAKPSLEREGQSWHSSTRWAENSEKH